MYFSEIRMRPGREREAIHDRLGSPGGDHRWIWRWFQAPAGTPRDFVFRRHLAHGTAHACAASGNEDMPVYLAVSQRPPRDELDGWVSRCRSFDPRLEAGALLDFELRANPTVRRTPLRHEPRPADAPRNAPRHDVVMDAKRKWAMAHAGAGEVDNADDAPPTMAELVYEAGNAWLARQGERHGFRIDGETLRVEGYRQHRMRQERAFSSLEFAGRLEVTEPAAFREALLHGVGSARAFGCGLLVVRRAA